MIWHTQRDLPRRLAGYSLWLEHLHSGRWYVLCALRPTDARSVLRWCDSHPDALCFRVSGQKI